MPSANLKSPGQTRLGHSRQRHRHRFRHQRRSDVPEFRLGRRSRRHPLRQQRRAALLLYLLHRLRAPEAPPRPAPAPAKVVPGQMGRPRQRCRPGVSGHQFRPQLLPHQPEPRRRGYELGDPTIWRGGRLGHDILPAEWEETLRPAGDAGENRLLSKTLF